VKSWALWAASEYEVEEHQEANSQQKWKEYDLEICLGRFRQARSLIDDSDWDLVLTSDVNESLTNWETKFMEIIEMSIPRNHFQEGEIFRGWQTNLLGKEMISFGMQGKMEASHFLIATSSKETEP